MTAHTKTLIAAIHQDDIEAVEQQLAAGADVNALDEDGRSPLYAALSPEMTAMLLARGADPNLACYGELRIYPLMMAVKRSSEATRRLLDAGADPRAVSGEGRTALHAIAESSNDDAAELVELLLARGAPADVRDEEGKLAFDLTSDDRLQALLRLPGMTTSRERLAELDAGAPIGPGDLDLLEARGAERHAEQQHEEAIADLCRVLAVEPQRTFALRLTAQSFEQLGRLAEAVTYWDQLVATEPDDHTRLYRALHLNAVLGRWTAVRADLDAIANGRNDLDDEEAQMVTSLRNRLAKAEAGDLAGAAVEDRPWED